MAGRCVYDSDDLYAQRQPRNRPFDFELELNKYCSRFDRKKYKICSDAQGNSIVVGSGAFGKVYEAKDERRRPVALKVMKKDHILQKHFERRVLDEIRIHSKLMHPRIVEMYECLHDENYIIIALELCSGGDLEHRLRRLPRGVFSEELAATTFRQIVEGVLYLHKVKTDRDGRIVGHPILHRDLKPSNICFTADNSVKICDFNLATEVLSDNQTNTTYCGTPGYMPPEVALSVPYSFEVDAYGLGCILYSMLFGEAPAKRNDHRSSKFDVQIPDGISVEAENLLRNLLCKDGRRRMPVKEIAKDPFLMKYTQRKGRDSDTRRRQASMDSGFDTQHTGSSFPDRQPRRAASRERPGIRAAPDQQCLVPFRRPPPVRPLRPPSEPGMSAFPPSSFAPSIPPRPPSARQSPAPSRRSHRDPNDDHGHLPRAVSSALDDPAPVVMVNDPAPSRRSRSPAPAKDKQTRGQPPEAKVQYISDVVRCAYFEDGKFIAWFPCGKIATTKGSADQVVAVKDKKRAELTKFEETQFQRVLHSVKALEKVCNEYCGVNAACNCFPLTMRPSTSQKK